MLPRLKYPTTANYNDWRDFGWGTAYKKEDEEKVEGGPGRRKRRMG